MHEPEQAHHVRGDVWFDPQLPLLDAGVSDCLDQETQPRAVNEVKMREVEADRRLRYP